MSRRRISAVGGVLFLGGGKKHFLVVDQILVVPIENSVADPSGEVWRCR
jgi:hypothetical protein